MPSKKRKRRRTAPMPLASAALIRFFEEETAGIEIRPEVVVVLAIALITFCIIVRALLG
jgi:preprotein translocase subunit Sec61beta